MTRVTLTKKEPTKTIKDLAHLVSGTFFRYVDAENDLWRLLSVDDVCDSTIDRALKDRGKLLVERVKNGQMYAEFSTAKVYEVEEIEIIESV
jgi:hypothetical protein